MIKVILFDVDGVIIRLRDKCFSQKLREDLGMDLDTKAIKDFFNNEFLLCETGKKDLKQELSARLKQWRYPGSVEDLMKFWFEGEAELDPEVVGQIRSLRSKGVKCFISTQNEKYRTEYLWETVGLKNFLDGKFSSVDIGYLKNNALFWESAYKSLSNYSKDEVLVWDNQMDMVDCAREFGFNAEFYKNFSDFLFTINSEYKIN